MLNRCEFIGNLGADPETRTFSDGGKVCNFRIACTEKWNDKNSGEKREKTEWVSVAAFGKPADTAEKYLHKGSKVYVSGKMQTRKWQDQSGQDRYSTEIVLQSFDAKLLMLDPPQNRAQGNTDTGARAHGDYGQAPKGHGSSSGYGSGGRGGSRDIDDDIPFAAEWRG